MMQYIVYYITLSELAVAIAILVLLVAIIGYVKQASGARYWTLAILKIFIVILLWWFLSFAISIVIMIHTAYYLEEKLFFIYTARTILFGVFCALLIIIEVRPKLTKKKSVSTSLDVSK